MPDIPQVPDEQGRESAGAAINTASDAAVETAVEPAVDTVEAAVDPVEAAVDPVEAATDPEDPAAEASTVVIEPGAPATEVDADADADPQSDDADVSRDEHPRVPTTGDDSEPQDVAAAPEVAEVADAAAESEAIEPVVLEPDEVEPPEPVEPEPDFKGIIAMLTADLDTSRREAARYKDMMLRKAADFENSKRRLAKQLDDSRKYGNESVLKEFVPVLDDLERATEHAKSNITGDDSQANAETFIDGVSLVMKKFQKVLERFGVTGFSSVGEPFNPQLHEAISQIETTDQPNGCVVTEFLRGYMLEDRLMRPALVVVARNTSPLPAAEPVSSPDTTDGSETDATDEPEKGSDDAS